MKRRPASRQRRHVRFKARVARWAQQLHVHPSQVRIQSMRRKWASCSTTGWVTFATDLIDEPGGFQDYVIVHELLHLRLPNHRRLFRALMASYVPKWRDHSEKAQQKRPF